ncbi:DMT family transporter [Desulforhopalus singaporensis]|uniref:S-adenosylmethionine uptake transporter n=1 Tax=Desulforhopalus singaporensis TaxID=91360 RepID=A0A1H0L2N5_9BACT|nr:DMT family transporter [Desulforhopalus singaporensis]SDO62231.1 S-adenosylmethionine uptake transporter [Desulforhopalus singaporensis]
MKKIYFTRSESSLPGIFFILAGGFTFSIQDVIIKLISISYPVHEIVFLRSVFALLPILLIIKLEGGFSLLQTRQASFQMVRGLLLLLSYTLYYFAIARIPIAQTVTVFFCAPLFISVFSVFFLDERIDRRGWFALVVGFTGIVTVMRPGSAIMGVDAVLPLISGLFYAISAVITRKYGEHESGASLVFYPTMTYLAGGGLLWYFIGDGSLLATAHPNMDFLLRRWTVPTGDDLLLIFGTGIIAAVGFYCLSQGYRLGRASIVAPFEFFVIPISIVWGFVFWRDIPDLVQLAGTILIIASGCYILRRL